MYQIVVFACCEIIRNGDKSRRVSRYFVGLRLMRDGTRHGCCSPSRLTEWNSSANTCKYHLVRMLEQLMIAEMSGCSSPSCQGGCREMNESIFIFRFFSIGHSQTKDVNSGTFASVFIDNFNTLAHHHMCQRIITFETCGICRLFV